MKRLDLGDIDKYCETIRMSVQAGKPVYANYFQQNLVGTRFSTFLSESCKSLVFLQSEGQLERVFFVSSSLVDLTNTLNNIPSRPLVLDYITKELTTDMKEALLNSRFELRAEFKRIINFKFNEMTSKYQPTIAIEKDAQILLARMHKDFDIFVDHLCDHKTLLSLIQANQVLLNLNNRKITGYLLYEIQGKRSFIRAWYSAFDDIFMGGAQLLGAYHRLMTTRDTTSTYGWVNVSNDSAVTIYQRYGYRFDGLIDAIMVRR